jgi:hypothetical protein
MKVVSITKEFRVSVAAYNRVVFSHPQNGTWMLALERKATVTPAGAAPVHVRAQPFGGAVRILNLIPLQELLGEIKFDSEHSRSEQDFRVLISPSEWEAIKGYCLRHLENPNDSELDSTPDRELVEEFQDSLGIHLKPDQYTVRPVGFVIEDDPVPTENRNALSQPTVRLYRIFEVHIVDEALCEIMLMNSQRYLDEDLYALALQDFKNGGEGHANSILTLPLSVVTESYLALPAGTRYRKIRIDNHELDESVLAVLEDIEVPQYQRI